VFLRKTILRLIYTNCSLIMFH